MAREPRVPGRIGKYEVGARLGAGMGGTVYRAHDPFVGRDVAIKVAHPGATASAVSAQGRRTFFSEAHAAGQLAHPNIVSVFDAGIEGPYSYIVMEYVPGSTLRAWGAQGTERLPRDRVIEIVFRCCRALDYAHRQGVIHRDIKPGNIMLTPDGAVKIADFSIALIMGMPWDGTTELAAGTPFYMAPEQVRGRDVGPAADLYAVGAVMFELLSGRRPYEETDVDALLRTIVDRAAPGLASVAPDVPAELAEVVDRALAHDVADRFASGAEFAGALARVHERLRRGDRHVAKAEQRDLLRGLGFFDGFDDGAIDAVLGASALLQYGAGETLIREGDMDESFYIVVLGDAVVSKGDVRIETLGKGDCFGEMGFLSENRRTATIVAESDTVVLRVSKALMDLAPAATQLLYYRTFVETLIYRLAVTSARLSAALQAREGDS